MRENDDNSNDDLLNTMISKAVVKPLTQDKEKQLDNIINNTDHAAEVNIINNTDRAMELMDEVNQLELLNTLKSKAKELTKMIMEPLTQVKQKQCDYTTVSSSIDISLRLGYIPSPMGYIPWARPMLMVYVIYFLTVFSC